MFLFDLTSELGGLLVQDCVPSQVRQVEPGEWGSGSLFARDFPRFEWISGRVLAAQQSAWLARALRNCPAIQKAQQPSFL